MQSSFGPKPEVLTLSKVHLFWMSIFCFLNFLHFADRYVIAGTVMQVMTYYDINYANMGLIQLVHNVCFVMGIPIISYFGDRYSNKNLISLSSIVWSISSLLGSIVPSGYYWAFLFTRGCAGFAQVGYTILMPSSISNMSNEHSSILTVLHMTVYLGAGFGYILGYKMYYTTGSWKWGLRIPPCFCIPFAILIFILMKEPIRRPEQEEPKLSFSNTLHAFQEDLSNLWFNRTYRYSCAAYIALAFNLGTIIFWMPHYLDVGTYIQKNRSAWMASSVVIYGIVFSMSVLGHFIYYWTSHYITRRNSRTDPLICIAMASICFVLLLVILTNANKLPLLIWVLIFLYGVLVFSNSVAVTQVAMSVVEPSKHAFSWRILIAILYLMGFSHGPYIYGLIVDASTKEKETDFGILFFHLQKASYPATAVFIVAIIFFIVTTFHIKEDQNYCNLLVMKKSKVTEFVAPNETPPGVNNER